MVSNYLDREADDSPHTSGHSGGSSSPRRQLRPCDWGLRVWNGSVAGWGRGRAFGMHARRHPNNVLSASASPAMRC